MGIFDPTERAERQNAADIARVASIRRELEEKETRTRDGVSFDALVAADEEVQALHRKLTIAEGVAARSGTLLEQARADAATRAADAEHAAEEKRATADAKIVREVDALAVKLADKLAELEASRVRTAAENAKRGSRPFILDAEERVRRQPARTIPAIFETRELWVDAEGRQPGEFRADGTGKLAPADHGAYERKRVPVQVQAEQFTPAKMPTRLAEAVKLVNLAGDQIWPPR